jgi:hypothetical protein
MSSSTPREVLTTLVSNPRPTADPRLIDFAQRWQTNVDQLVTLRSDLEQ